ncbi:MAG: HNH endonuclease [Comamonadaceae bacterium]|nr:MAG: HNH endonuclease [Comamonadaceae bacterium]
MRKPWTPHQLKLLRELYPDHTAASVSLVLGRETGSVYRKANELGLSKSEAFQQSTASGRIRRGRTDPRMVATQIKPGAEPWNKGVKGSTGLHENSKRTQFKKGRAASESRNYVPIGSLRISKDGYLERKVTDDPALAPTRRWTAVHRLVWQATNGAIPPGHIVVFRTGKKTTVLEDVTADRLECITRAENAQRNHPRNRSPELAKLVQLKGAITRQVNRIAREAREKSQ